MIYVAERAAAVCATLAKLKTTTGTIDAALSSRAELARPVRVYVAVPISAGNRRSLRAIGGWARQCGVDGVLATVPLGEAPPEGISEVIDEVGRDNVTPAHLKAWLRGERSGGGRGGLRAEILEDGTLLLSSHLSPVGSLSQQDPAQLWLSAGEQLRGVRAHPRPWDEVELVPERLRSER